MQQRKRARRAVGGIEVAASLAARVAPRALRPAIDQLRLDVRSVFDGLRGVREPSFSTPSRPPLPPAALRDIDPLFELLPRRLKAPYSTLRRDLAMVARDLRGERTSPIVPRPARTTSARDASAAPGPRRARVTRLTRETPDATSIELVALDGAPIAFEAGQFLTLHVAIDGEVLRRAYSLSSAPLDGVARITCKRIEGGRVSTYLHERLREGDVVEVLGPSGSFVPRARAEGEGGARHVVLIAGGSGITPCWSIARTVLAREPDARVTLIFGNRAERDVIFRDAIDAVARAVGDRLRVIHVLSDPEGAHDGPRGVLDGATFDAIAGELELERRGHERHALEHRAPEYFVCGPAPMMDAVRAVLAARGVDGSRVREERFSSPGERRASVALEPQLVTVRRGRDERSFRVAPTQTVLEAALASGVALPFSCAIGGCAACKCRLVEGDVAMDEPSCLRADERAAGWVLTCVGHPTRATILEVP